MKVLEFADRMSGCGFMLQKEYAHRLAAPCSQKEYGRMSILMQSFFDIKLLNLVKKELFQPVPKVDSAILWMKPTDKPINEALKNVLKNLTRDAFSQRRKTVRNSLANYLPYLEKANIDLGLRAENISVEEYHELSREILKNS